MREAKCQEVIQHAVGEAARDASASESLLRQAVRELEDFDMKVTLWRTVQQAEQGEANHRVSRVSCQGRRMRPWRPRLWRPF